METIARSCIKDKRIICAPSTLESELMKKLDKRRKDVGRCVRILRSCDIDWREWVIMKDPPMHQMVRMDIVCSFHVHSLYILPMIIYSGI